MLVKDKIFSSIWFENEKVLIIDQTKLPHNFVIKELKSLSDFSKAIVNMEVRGAPLIGITALFGIANEMRKDSSLASLERALKTLRKTRPTAVNLFWALNSIESLLRKTKKKLRNDVAIDFANNMALQDKVINNKIGENGYKIFKEILSKKKTKELNLLTHCNAGWLATVDWGTAISPIYVSSLKGMKIKVFVSETRPRNQGSALTAWELENQNIDYEIIVDNASGFLMHNNMVDAVIVGADRITSSGDVCNKIGTYLKAVACKDNGVPFFAAAPTSTIDWKEKSKGKSIEIEIRDGKEVLTMHGKALSNNSTEEIIVSPESSKAFNPAFDVTPSKFVSKIITELGSFKTNRKELNNLRNLSKDKMV